MKGVPAGGVDCPNTSIALIKRLSLAFKKLNGFFDLINIFKFILQKINVKYEYKLINTFFTKATCVNSWIKTSIFNNIIFNKLC